MKNVMKKNHPKMNEVPLLSIVTINYNNQAGLDRTLSSIFDTTIPFLIESIIIDGASSDASVEVIKKYEPKIAYWQSERDKGIYDAMNIGLAKSTGRYVWFLNSGDLVNERSTLKHLHPVLLQDKWDIVYGETQMVDIQYNVIGSGSENSNRPLPETLHYNSFKYGMNVVHQSFIVKREIAPLYDLRLKHVSDIDWILRILKTEPNSYLFSEPISRFVLEGHSSQNRKAANWERFKLFSKHYGLLNNLLNHVKILFQYLK